MAYHDRLHGRGMIKVHYPHIIGWLALKPGAFANCVYRDQLFPTKTFREAYAALCQRAGSRADATYLHILRLAAVAEEAEVEAALALLLEVWGYIRRNARVADHGPTRRSDAQHAGLSDPHGLSESRLNRRRTGGTAAQLGARLPPKRNSAVSSIQWAGNRAVA